MHNFSVYLLRCADGSYFTGTATNLSAVIDAHKKGADSQSYTYTRRPVALLYAGQFATQEEADAWEKRLREWSQKQGDTTSKMLPTESAGFP